MTTAYDGLTSRRRRSLQRATAGGLVLLAVSLPLNALAADGILPSSDSPAVLVVDDDKGAPDACLGATHDSITGAVAAAQAGDIIEVCPGLYEETVRVEKPMTIRATTDAIQATTAVDCFTEETVEADPAAQAIITAPAGVATTLMRLSADDIEVRGLVFRGPGFVRGLVPNVAAILTSPEHSGIRIRDNLVMANDVAIHFWSNGEKLSSVEGNCLRLNGWGVSNVGVPLVNARIEGNSTFRTFNYAYELIGPGGAQRVTVENNVLGSDDSGFLIGSTIATKVENNVVRSARVGLRLFGDNHVLTVEGNSFEVSLVGVASPSNRPRNDHVTISGNTVTGTVSSAGIGIGANALEDSTISENVVTDAAGDGIVLLTGNRDNLVEKNIVLRNAADGIRIAAGATDNELTENIVLGNGYKLPAPSAPPFVDARDDAWPSNLWSKNVCVTDFPVALICGVD